MKNDPIERRPLADQARHRAAELRHEAIRAAWDALWRALRRPVATRHAAQPPRA